ncbi:MAG: (d)CMP kinase [Thermoguttaceae bacterium]|nr:(d)CMP kinase [Thermoguttaceae bacterium]MDW8036615.1 (d)CMP kinase [Thermoguttaceae bacterium]
MIVTIDGPAGAGKSTVAKALAHRLGFAYLDTGAMYRAVALAALQRGVDWTQPEALAHLAHQIQIDFQNDRVFLDGQDVTEAIRDWQITQITPYVADNPQVRRRLIQLQRHWARGRNIVTEGRDQGTLAFPEAECKFFLTASPEERARRRLRELQARGLSATFEQVLADQQRRDQEDANRPFGRLARAPDAVEVATDGLSIDEVVDRLAELVRQRQQKSSVRNMNLHHPEHKVNFMNL